MSRLFARFTFVIASITLMGCATAATPTRLPVPTSVVQSTTIPTAVPTAAPTAAPTRMPTVTVTSVLSPVPAVKTTPTRTPTLGAGTMRVKLYFVALNDNGVAGKKFGCNDSLVAVDRAIPTTNAPLTAALKELLSLTDQNYGQSGLYNSLYQSKLRIDSIAIVNAKATINLSGSLVLGGVCDNPRVEAQIEQVALQFSTVKTVAVFLNGKTLQQALSEKGP
jgi:hypothetical protein